MLGIEQDPSSFDFHWTHETNVELKTAITALHSRNSDGRRATALITLSGDNLVVVATQGHAQ